MQYLILSNYKIWNKLELQWVGENMQIEYWEGLVATGFPLVLGISP